MSWKEQCLNQNMISESCVKTGLLLAMYFFCSYYGQHLSYIYIYIYSTRETCKIIYLQMSFNTTKPSCQSLMIYVPQ